MRYIPSRHVTSPRKISARDTTISGRWRGGFSCAPIIPGRGTALQIYNTRADKYGNSDSLILEPIPARIPPPVGPRSKQTRDNTLRQSLFNFSKKINMALFKVEGHLWHRPENSLRWPINHHVRALTIVLWSRQQERWQTLSVVHISTTFVDLGPLNSFDGRMTKQ